MKLIYGFIAILIGVLAWYLDMSKGLKTPQLFFFLGSLYGMFIMLALR